MHNRESGTFYRTRDLLGKGAKGENCKARIREKQSSPALDWRAGRRCVQAGSEDDDCRKQWTNENEDCSAPYYGFRLACYLPLSAGDHRCYRHQDFERSWHCELPALPFCPASDKEKVFMCNLSGERWRKYQPFRLTSLPIRRGITPPNRSLSAATLKDHFVLVVYVEPPTATLLVPSSSPHATGRTHLDTDSTLHLDQKMT